MFEGELCFDLRLLVMCELVFRVVCVPMDTVEDFSGPLRFVVVDQPTRALRDEEDTTSQDERGEALYRERNIPLGAAGLHVEEADTDPGRGGVTDVDRHAVETYEQSSCMRRYDFALPERNQHNDLTDLRVCEWEFHSDAVISTHPESRD